MPMPLPGIERSHLAQALPLCAIAWGALAFGGVYAWAYWPLAGVCLLSGCLATYVARDAAAKSADATLVGVLAVLAGAILVQLFPLPVRTLSAFSPHTIGPASPAESRVCGRPDALACHLGLAARHDRGLCALSLHLALLLVGTARLLIDDGKPRPGSRR